MALTIDLGKRFGVATADLTKKFNPDQPRDPNTGRWIKVGTMVRELMDVLQRHRDADPRLADQLSGHIERTAHERGLRSGNRRGDLVRFDPARHQVASGRAPKPGTMVEVDQPGWDVAQFRLDGGDETGNPSMVSLVPARVRRSDVAQANDYDTKPRKPRATTRLTAKPEPDYGHMLTTIRDLPTKPESHDVVRRALEPLTIPQLRALATAAGFRVGSKARKQEIRDQLERDLIGARLDHETILRGAWDRPPAPAAPKPMRDRVTDAYTSRRQDGNPWMSLADLRDELGDVDRAEQDRTLMDMLDAKQIRLIPEENQKAIDARVRAAALRVSGEDKHVIGFRDVIEHPVAAGFTARADEINRLTAEIGRTSDPAELKKPKAPKRDHAADFRAISGHDDIWGARDRQREGKA